MTERVGETSLVVSKCAPDKEIGEEDSGNVYIRSWKTLPGLSAQYVSTIYDVNGHILANFPEPPE